MPLGGMDRTSPCLSSSAREMGFSEMYCIRCGRGRWKRMICMLLALAHVTSGTLEAPVVTRTQDESMSREAFALETPRTCMLVWPQSSKMRLMGCGALRKRVPAFKTHSTLRTWDSGQHIATTAWRLGLYEASDLDMVDDGHDKDNQTQEPPTDNHTRSTQPQKNGRPE